MNVLVACTLDRYILYISQSYPGSTNDLEIAKRTKSMWYDLLDQREWCLADSGFNGLDGQGWQVITSSAHNHKWRHLHSYDRIIIENVFARIKVFRALREKLRTPVKDSIKALKRHNLPWVVVASLYNVYLHPRYMTHH